MDMYVKHKKGQPFYDERIQLNLREFLMFTDEISEGGAKFTDFEESSPEAKKVEDMAQKSWDFFKAQPYEPVKVEGTGKARGPEKKSAADILNDQVFHAQLQAAIKDKKIQHMDFSNYTGRLVSTNPEKAKAQAE